MVSRASAVLVVCSAQLSLEPLALAAPAGQSRESRARQPRESNGGHPVRASTTPKGAETTPRGAATEAEMTRARSNFVEGRALMAEERWQAAAEAFERAASLHPTPGLYYHVGFCQEQTEQLVAARQSYQQALRLGEPQGDSRDVNVLVHEALERVEVQLARLQLTGAPPLTELWLDGRQVSSQEELWAEAGEHEVHWRADGYAPRKRTLRLSAGQRGQLELQLTRLAPCDDSADPSASGRSRTAALQKQHPAFAPLVYGGAGVLVAGLIAGASGLALALYSSDQTETFRQQIDELGGSCVGAPQGPLQSACGNLQHAVDTQDAATAVAIVGAAAAAAGTTAAVIGLVFYRDRQLELSSWPVPFGGGMSLSGHF